MKTCSVSIISKRSLPPKGFSQKRKPQNCLVIWQRNRRFGADHQYADKTGGRFVQQNYTQPIGRKDIAAAVGVNPNYLSQIFHQEMSISLVEYLNRFRIQKAKE